MADMPELSVTDPDFTAIMEYFIGNEVDERNTILTVRQKELIKITSLTAQQSYKLLKEEVANALSLDVSPVEIKEAVIQCAPYSGFPRTADALTAVNQVFLEQGIELPLEGQSTVNEGTRFDSGQEAQVSIFGEGMRQPEGTGPEELSRTTYYLISNCFGDYYTRDGLDLETREMLTLVVLTNLGLEQMGGHMNGNALMGHDREFITEMIYECLPYMGYPRMLNAFRYLNDTLPEDGAGEDGTGNTPAFAGGTTEAAVTEQIPGEPADNEHFTGRAWVKMMDLDASYGCPGIGLVTFEPEARNNWHSHEGGQILIVTSGQGYYQEEGQSARLLNEGDVVEVGANVKHWHGAAADSWFSHIALETNPELRGMEWMEPVSDEAYENMEVSNPGAAAAYPIGNKASSDMFLGDAYAKMIQADDFYNLPGVGYVTFEPEARNNWHSHGGIQILIATSGVGYCQFEGQAAYRMEPGDMVVVPVGVKHWHGGGEDGNFVHLSVSVPAPEGTETVQGGWFEAVEDSQYQEAIRTAVSAGE